MALKVVLDDFNSDLNFIIEDHGYGASVLNYPLGFRLMWGGGRANYGVCKGKVYFEMKIVEFLDGVCDSEELEPHPNVVRVGWSTNTCHLALGEQMWSFGYGGTGKFVHRNQVIAYGEAFTKNDVIGTMLDLDSKPPTLAFMKNGKDLGVAHTLQRFPVGDKQMALFPHVFNKNCRVKINFGQTTPWFEPPSGFTFIDHLPDPAKIRGSLPAQSRSECEVIMLVGLPGCGKTKWALKKQKDKPEKRYNILGTDQVLVQMRVLGLRRNYESRWQLLLELATECFNSLVGIAASKNRNYILDQTKCVSNSDRKETMKPFREFHKMAVVIQPEDAELIRRAKERTAKTKKEIPFNQVRKMKANYNLPVEGDGVFDEVIYSELPQQEVISLVDRYNQENSEYRS